MNPHTLNCQIEQAEDVNEIDVTLAPLVTFKDGKATKAELNITKLDALTVNSTVITGAAWVEKNFNLFQGEIIDEINDFAHKKMRQALSRIGQETELRRRHHAMLVVPESRPRHDHSHLT